MGGNARSQTPLAHRQKRRPLRRPTDAQIDRIISILDRAWGQATCELDHDGPFQLLVAAILSAQSPDRRKSGRVERVVNQVTPALFDRYPDARALAAADPGELERIIRPTGFYRLKASKLLSLAQALADRHGGEVPHTMGALGKLPGVTRKTANLVLGNFFGLTVGIAVDSHVRRVSRRLGLTRAHDARAVERDLMAVLPRVRWIDIANEITWHGERVCHPREPSCDACPLATECPSFTPAPDPYALYGLTPPRELSH